MKKLICFISLNILVNSTATYFWLLVTNSSTPSPGKEIIFIVYILIITFLFWGFKSIREIGLFTSIAGLLSGIFGLLTIMTYFPKAFHEIDLTREGLTILLSGGAFFAILYLVYGLLIYFTQKLINLKFK